MTTTAEKWKALGKLNKQVQKCHIEMENMASELGTESLIQFYLHGLGNMTRMVSVAIDAAANENTSLDEDDEYTEDLRLLERDVVSTVGEKYRALVAQNAASARPFNEGAAFLERVAEQVQQDLMDWHVHTTWPPCPRQPNHPLWFSDGAWRCERDHVQIPLGQIAARRSPRDE